MTLSWRVQKTWLEDGGHKSYIFTINFWEWGKSQQVQYIVERKQQTSFRIGKNIVLKKFIDLDLFKWPHFHWIYSRKICQKIDPWIRVNFRGSTFEKGPPPSLRLVAIRGQREDGQPSFSKNWKTTFFSRYSKFILIGNWNCSKTTPVFFFLEYLNKYCT